MTTRWPTSLSPVSCAFGRSRNVAFQSDVASRQASAVERGQPLWTSDCEFELRPDQIETFRNTVETAEGMRAFYLVGDFANPYPSLHPSVRTAEALLWTGTARSKWRWHGTTLRFNWTRATVDYDSFAASIAVATTAASGATSVVLSGFPTNRPVMSRGDLIEIGERLYMLDRHLFSNGSGQVTASLSTALLATATAGVTVVKVLSPATIMRIDSAEWDMSRQWSEPFHRASIKFIEVPA